MTNERLAIKSLDLLYFTFLTSKLAFMSASEYNSDVGKTYKPPPGAMMRLEKC